MNRDHERFEIFAVENWHSEKSSYTTTNILFHEETEFQNDIKKF